MEARKFFRKITTLESRDVVSRDLFAIPSPIPQFAIPIPLVKISRFRFRFHCKIIKPYFWENFHFRALCCKKLCRMLLCQLLPPPSIDFISPLVTLFRVFENLISMFKIFRDSDTDSNSTSKFFAIPIPLKISRFHRFRFHITVRKWCQNSFHDFKKCIEQRRTHEKHLKIRKCCLRCL